MQIKRHLQFRLRTLLILVALVAVCLAWSVFWNRRISTLIVERNNAIRSTQISRLSFENGGSAKELAVAQATYNQRKQTLNDAWRISGFGLFIDP